MPRKNEKGKRHSATKKRDGDDDGERREPARERRAPGTAQACRIDVVHRNFPPLPASSFPSFSSSPFPSARSSPFPTLTSSNLYPPPTLPNLPLFPRCPPSPFFFTPRSLLFPIFPFLSPKFSFSPLLIYSHLPFLVVCSPSFSSASALRLLGGRQTEIKFQFRFDLSRVVF